jgi:hypothetical protein
VKNVSTSLPNSCVLSSMFCLILVILCVVVKFELVVVVGFVEITPIHPLKVLSWVIGHFSNFIMESVFSKEGK